MTILPKIKKVTSATTSSASAVPHSGTATTSSSGPNGEGPSGLTGVPDNRKRCADRTGPDLSSLTSVTSAAEAVSAVHINGPSAPKRSRHREPAIASPGSERRHHRHSLLLSLHDSATASSNKKTSSTGQSSTGSCAGYSDESEVGDGLAAGSGMKLATGGSDSPLTPSPGDHNNNCSSGSASGLMVMHDPDASPSDLPEGQTSAPASPTGYNSGDEYGGRATSAGARTTAVTPEQLMERERRFEKKLRKKGLVIVKMGEDGACLFRAVADQVYGDENMHSLVRTLCCDYMTKNADYFSQYVTEEFPQYVARKRRDHIQGNHIELQALSEIFARPIEVYHYNSEPINIFQSGQDDEMLPEDEEEPIRLSYHTSCYNDSGHYNSVRTLRGTFKPKGTLLHMTPPHVMESAMRNSETDALEKAMLEDKIRATDWEATSEALEEQVARESYLEWLRENERRRRLTGQATGRLSPTGLTTTSSTITASTTETGNRSPQAGGSSYDQNQVQTGRTQQWSLFQGQQNQLQASFASEHNSPKDHKTGASSFYYDQMPDGPEAEREILARVMLASRQEYLDSLKARRSPVGECRSPKNSSRGSTPPPSSSRT